MKKFLLTTVAAGLMFCINAKAQQTNTDANAPVITFQHDTIDYGTIARNADGFRIFKFTNTGKEPLIIKEAPTSCGCTASSIPKEPIQPGQSSEIKVHYATERVGRFTKSITIVSNATVPRKMIMIIGNVLPDPTVTTVPAVNAGK